MAKTVQESVVWSVARHRWLLESCLARDMLGSDYFHVPGGAGAAAARADVLVDFLLRRLGSGEELAGCVYMCVAMSCSVFAC
jgi:hypothetical protein